MVNPPVVFFRTSRGDEPVAQYIEDLPKDERSAIDGILIDLGESGRLEFPHGRKIVGYKGLYEIRYKRHRIFYFYHGGEIVLVHAYKKQSQETPAKELELAFKRMRLWQSFVERRKEL